MGSQRLCRWAAGTLTSSLYLALLSMPSFTTHLLLAGHARRRVQGRLHLLVFLEFGGMHPVYQHAYYSAQLRGEQKSFGASLGNLISKYKAMINAKDLASSVVSCQPGLTYASAVAHLVCMPMVWLKQSEGSFFWLSVLAVVQARLCKAGTLLGLVLQHCCPADGRGADETLMMHCAFSFAADLAPGALPDSHFYSNCCVFGQSSSVSGGVVKWFHQMVACLTNCMLCAISSADGLRLHLFAPMFCSEAVRGTAAHGALRHCLWPAAARAGGPGWRAPRCGCRQGRRHPQAHHIWRAGTPEAAAA